MLQPEEYWILRARPHATDPNKCYWDKFALRMLPDVKIQKGAKIEFPALQNRANLSFNLDQNTDQNTDDGTNRTVRPEHDEFDYEAILAGDKTMTITLDQDIQLIKDIQKGMHSRGFREVWLNDEDRAIVLNSDGDLILVRLNPSGFVEETRTNIIGRTWAHPAYAGNCVYARSDTEIICVVLPINTTQSE